MVACPDCFDERITETAFYCTCPKHYGSYDAAMNAALAHLAYMKSIDDPSHRNTLPNNIQTGLSSSCSQYVKTVREAMRCKWCDKEKK